MDLSQVSQMASWLDEEHRRDKAELIRLQQRFDNQAVELQDQARIVQDLEGRLAGLSAQLLKFGQIEAAIDQLKTEVVQMIAQADERRQQELRETERVRAIERDNTSKALNEIRRDLQRLPRIDEEMGARRAEQQRVGESLLVVQQEVGAFKQDLENKVRGIPFLEDSRQQDSKRISRLQQDALEAMKRIEQQASRLQMVEDVWRRQERDTGELQVLVTQTRTKQREFIDGQLLEMEQVKRLVAEAVEKVEVAASKIDAFAARLQEFAEAFRDDRQVVASVDRFQEQMRREQVQVAELQRLAEERQKHGLEQWQEENEKRWRKELLTRDHQWAEETKRHQQLADQFRTVETRLGQHQVHIDAAWKFLEAQITFETQEQRRWLGEMNKLLEDRPKRE